MTDLAKSFEPAAIEARWAPLWEQSGVYAPSLDPAKPSFSIQLPPPNVTGTLHMGHAFNQTIMDALTRYHRMRGFNTLWLPGTDHAGIATQMVVERQLAAQGIKRTDLGRDRDEQRPDRFQVGQKVDAMVTGFDRSKKPNFSIKAMQLAEEKQAVAQYGSSDSGASLGDILGEALKARDSKK